MSRRIVLIRSLMISLDMLHRLTELEKQEFKKVQRVSPHPVFPESLFGMVGSMMQEMASSWPFSMSTIFISQICVDGRCNDYNRMVVFHFKRCCGFKDGIPDPDLFAFIIE